MKTSRFVPFDAPVVGSEALPGVAPEGVEAARRQSGMVVQPLYELDAEAAAKALRDQMPGRERGETAVRNALRRLLAE